MEIGSIILENLQTRRIIVNLLPVPTAFSITILTALQEEILTKLSSVKRKKQYTNVSNAKDFVSKWNNLGLEVRKNMHLL